MDNFFIFSVPVTIGRGGKRLRVRGVRDEERKETTNGARDRARAGRSVTRKGVAAKIVRSATQLSVANGDPRCRIPLPDGAEATRPCRTRKLRTLETDSDFLTADPPNSSAACWIIDFDRRPRRIRTNVVSVTHWPQCTVTRIETRRNGRACTRVKPYCTAHAVQFSFAE